MLRPLQGSRPSHVVPYNRTRQTHTRQRHSTNSVVYTSTHASLASMQELGAAPPRVPTRPSYLQLASAPPAVKPLTYLFGTREPRPGPPCVRSRCRGSDAPDQEGMLRDALVAFFCAYAIAECANEVHAVPLQCGADVNCAWGLEGATADGK